MRRGRARLRRVVEAPYRISAPKPPAPPDPYLQAWLRLTIRRWLSLISLGMLLPGFALIVVPLLGGWGGPVFVADVILLLVSSTAFARLVCPACRRPFAYRDPVWGPRSPLDLLCMRCVHCGIRAGTPKQ
jgi:hypothetical protein